MKHIHKIILAVFIGIIIIQAVSSFQLSTVYNPFTGKLDYTVTSNFSGDNVTADYFFGNGSQLTDLSHSLDDAYDDGPIINVDDTYIHWNVSVDGFYIDLISPATFYISGNNFAEDYLIIDPSVLSGRFRSVSWSPLTDGGYDLGYFGDGTDYRWNDLFLSGNLSDGTNSLTVANAKTAYDYTIANYTNKSNYWDNLNTPSDFTTITASGLITAGEFSGQQNWSDNQNYPSACPNNNAITQLDDSVTCSDDWVNEAGDTMTGNLNMGNNNITNISIINATLYYGNGSQLTGISAGFENPAVENLDMSGYSISNVNVLDVDGTASFDSRVYFATDELYLYHSSKARIKIGTTTGMVQLVIGSDTGFNQPYIGVQNSLGKSQLIFGDLNDLINRKNFDHADQANPTFYIHSDVNPDTDNTQWISFTHNQTDGIIDVGVGNIVIRKNLTVEGENTWVQNITATSYNDWTIADLKTNKQSLESINKISRDGNKINHSSLSDFIRVKIPTYETIVIGEQCDNETICIAYETELNETCTKFENVTICTPLYKKQFKEYKEGRNIGNSITEIWNGIKRLISWNEEQDIEIDKLKQENQLLKDCITNSNSFEALKSCIGN